MVGVVGLDKEKQEQADCLLLLFYAYRIPTGAVSADQELPSTGSPFPNL
ncbi:hypothetical protein [Ammoniphilus sp. 3BR4]